MATSRNPASDSDIDVGATNYSEIVLSDLCVDLAESHSSGNLDSSNAAVLSGASICHSDINAADIMGPDREGVAAR